MERAMVCYPEWGRRQLVGVGSLLEPTRHRVAGSYKPPEGIGNQTQVFERGGIPSKPLSHLFTLFRK